MCGIAVGVVGGMAAYAVQNAGTSSWSRRGFVMSGITGGVLGGFGRIWAGAQTSAKLLNNGWHGIKQSTQVTLTMARVVPFMRRKLSHHTRAWAHVLSRFRRY
ncbi:hypothetical protein ACIA8G_30540 [Lentzea sp. NPDC051213]|uniref:hypothetical protein n=1 Tax=Lentzea sp. NPDC051213 TaxID=3364126 RepID=UPI0037B2728C